MATNTNQMWKEATLFSPAQALCFPQHQAAGKLACLQHGLNLPPPPRGIQKLHSGFPPRQVDACSSTDACLS